MPEGATLLMGRCNPYGAETGGVKRVLGGLYGPRSAETPGAGLPAAAAQGEWACKNRAQVRCRFVCRCGHTGHVMELCSWHDEDNWRGEAVGGTFRQVRETIRVRGHFEEIQKRQADFCPRCGFPPNGADGVDYAALHKAVQVWQAELSALVARGKWHHPDAQRIRLTIEDASKQYDQGIARGIVHRCPGKLIPVS